MTWAEIIQSILPKVLVVVSIGLLVLLLTRVSFLRTSPKITDVIQAIVAVGLLVAAFFGIQEYKTIRRPYVSLIEVKASSNLTDHRTLVRIPSDLEDERKYGPVSDELKALVNKYAPSDVFRNVPNKVRDAVEEILVDLHFKNTGPIAATQCKISVASLKDHAGKALSDLWAEYEY